MSVTRSIPYVLALFTFALLSHAQQIQVLHSFQAGTDGLSPDSRLTADRLGNLYGMTPYGGTPSAGCPSGCGTVYELNASENYAESVIHSFEGADGANPLHSNPAFGPDGSLYGVAKSGGGTSACNGGCGTVFRLTPSEGSWTEQVLHFFTHGPDGAQPNGGLIFDKKGNLYGVTLVGANGSASGTIFKLSLSAPNEIESYPLSSVLAGATGALVADAGGNIFGVSRDGGFGDHGAIFELSPSSNGPVFQIIYSFCVETCVDGDSPNGNLIIRGSNLYGTTSSGGPNNTGVVFELAPTANGWEETTIYAFSATGPTDGSFPQDGLVFDQSGTLYGTTESGGRHNAGTVFAIALNGANSTEHVIHSFDGTDGAGPYAAPLPYKGGLFGTTTSHGQFGNGTVYQITP